MKYEMIKIDELEFTTRDSIIIKISKFTQGK